MWPFAKRGARVGAFEPPRSSKLDYAAFEHNNVYIKIWLPEVLSRALDEVSSAREESRPDVLREFLFEHVYGRQELERLIAWKQREDAKTVREPLPPYEGVSQPYASLEMIGKATEDVKLWLPKKLKEEITGLAKLAGMGLSDYCRKTLVRILLGEKVHQQWQAAIGQVPPDARQAEEEV